MLTFCSGNCCAMAIDAAKATARAADNFGRRCIRRKLLSDEFAEGKSYCADGSSYCQRRVASQMMAPTASEIAAAAKVNLLRVKNSATEMRVPRMGTTRPGVRKPSVSLRRRGSAAQVN